MSMRSLRSPWAERWLTPLGAPVDIASLVFFRVCFGSILHWEIWRYFLKGRIPVVYIEPEFHFQYLGFGWVDPLPGAWMYAVFALLGVFALGIALGAFYRASCLLYGMGFLYVFLIEETRYLNHHYLVILLCFLMAAVPAHRSFSVDARMRPRLKSDTAPVWALWLLRTQIGIVYFYAGLAKLKGDWLAGRPTIYMFMKAAEEQEWLQIFDPVGAAYFLSYGGLMLDLFVVPFLLWRRTRLAAFTATLFFHASNKLLFAIGIFPFMMTAATLLFFEPDWPRRLAHWFRPPTRRSRDATPGPAPAGFRPERLHPALAVALGLYLLVQFTIPLRHYAYPGSVTWTEEGQYFAWHMLLRSKDARSMFWVFDRDSGRQLKIDPGNVLPVWQAAQFAKRPDMVVQFAHYLEEQLRNRGLKDFEVRATVWVSLNGREAELLVDPEIDLTQVRRSLFPRPYIMPQVKPLPPMAEAAAWVDERLGTESVD